MSVSSTAEGTTDGSSMLAPLAGAIWRLCAAYFGWRLQRSAIVLLGSMSDAELSDIGLSRSDIAAAVRGARP